MTKLLKLFCLVLSITHFVHAMKQSVPKQRIIDRTRIYLAKIQNNTSSGFKAIIKNGNEHEGDKNKTKIINEQILADNHESVKHGAGGINKGTVYLYKGNKVPLQFDFDVRGSIGTRLRLICRENGKNKVLKLEKITKYYSKLEVSLIIAHNLKDSTFDFTVTK